METIRRTFLAALLLVASLTQALAGDVHVMISGALTEAYNRLRPAFEQASGHRLVTSYGASMGQAADAIPQRLARGEPADLIILAAGGFDALVPRNLVIPGSRVDLVNSGIALAVRAGQPRPDISTVDALRRALLAAPSIAYSASASGVYYETVLVDRLGIRAEVMPRSRRIMSERVGTVVARGDAALGLQQTSEMLPIPGIEIIGPLPAEVQRMTIFSAGLPANVQNREGAAALIAFLRGPVAEPVIRATGLDPIR